MSDGPSVRSTPPTPMPRAVLCPYCGAISGGVHRCTNCGGHLDALSRQATQNAMGPWQVRDTQHPHKPGCSYETLCKLCDQGKVTTESVLRGPTTGQFWMLARRVPGIAHRLGVCHSCQAPAKPDEYACRACGALFAGERDRQHLGLGPIRPLPGQESPEMVAARLSVRMPEPPTPMPGAARNGVNAALDCTRAAGGASAGSERLRSVERRVVVLRSQLVGSLCANIVLVAAMVVAVTLLATRPGDAPRAVGRSDVRDPLFLGAGAAPRLEIGESPNEGESDGLDFGGRGAGQAEEEMPPVPGTVTPIPSREFTPPVVPDRDLDITLMNWTDAEAWVRSQVDEQDAGSIRRGLAMLADYEAANGLPAAGAELRRAWEFRLEQLRLQALP
ncbi:MAG: transposase [Phycisphaerales bacterium]|nr:transposase [Phycisphaerales bacterium]